MVPFLHGTLQPQGVKDPLNNAPVRAEELGRFCPNAEVSGVDFGRAGRGQARQGAGGQARGSKGSHGARPAGTVAARAACYARLWPLAQLRSTCLPLPAPGCQAGCGALVRVLWFLVVCSPAAGGAARCPARFACLPACCRPTLFEQPPSALLPAQPLGLCPPCYCLAPCSPHDEVPEEVNRHILRFIEQSVLPAMAARQAGQGAGGAAAAAAVAAPAAPME